MADNMGTSQRIDWVEPEVREIAIAETSLLPNHGGDGETIWTDCTLS
ncbi:MAG: hypothetical protein V4574_02955 [Pseudomonadota bacterium]